MHQFQSSLRRDSLKQKHTSFFSDPEKDHKITSLFNLIQKRINTGHHGSLLSPSDSSDISILSLPSLLENILYILSKPIRNSNDIFILKLYLTHLKEIKMLFFNGKDAEFLSKNPTQTTQCDDLLSRVSTHIKYEKHPKNKVLMRFGDKGDKYYIILSGSVSILIPHEQVTHLSVVDYMKYLILLYIGKENELLSKTITSNASSSGYSFIEKDVISIFDLFNLIRETKVISSRNADTKYYDVLINKLSKGKHINFDNRHDIEMLFNKHLIGNPLLNVLHYNVLYVLYKFMEEKYEEFVHNNNNNYNYYDDCSINYQHVKPHLPLNDMFTVNEYISLYEPQTSNSTIHDPLIKYYKYDYVTSLYSGQGFGELALQGVHLRRTATILISSDTCHFGTLTKSVYELCLKTAKNRLRYKAVNYFLKGPIFKSVSTNLFEGKIFNFFVNSEYERGAMLFRRGCCLDKVYFIKEGEVELYMKLTLQELNALIVELGGKGDGDVHNRSGIEMNKKIKFRIGTLKNDEIIGMEDCVSCTKNVYFCSCEVISSVIQVYVLEKHFLHVIKSDKTIKNNINEYITIKNSIMLNRLNELYYQQLQPTLTDIRGTSEVMKIIQTKQVTLLSPKNRKQLNLTATKSQLNLKTVNKEQCTMVLKGRHRKTLTSPLVSVDNVNAFNIDVIPQQQQQQQQTMFNNTLLSFKLSVLADVERYRNVLSLSNESRYKKVYVSRQIHNKCSYSNSNNNIICNRGIIKPKIVNEYKIKYSSPLFTNSDKNIFTKYHKYKINKYHYERKFHELITDNNNVTPSSPTINTEPKLSFRKNIIDMLMLDKWHENELTSSSSKTLFNSTRTHRYHSKAHNNNNNTTKRKRIKGMLLGFKYTS